MNVMLFIKKPLICTSSMVSRTLISTLILMPIFATALSFKRTFAIAIYYIVVMKEAADAICIAASEGSPIP